jgi:BirA family biotin operon repressor/biotin-[acetyl-CoA-carboxylase] ligase
MGGILIESVTSSAKAPISGPTVVIGIGLNINMPSAAGEAIDQPWISLNQILKQSIDRNPLLALLLEQLITDLQCFEQLDLADFQQQWQNWDILNGRSVTVLQQHKQLVGTVQGLDKQGRIGIKLHPSGAVKYFSSADIRLRKF